MNIIRRRGWEIPEREVTPEHLAFSRRGLMAGAGALALTPGLAQAQRVSDLANIPDPTADLYPAKRNEKYVLYLSMKDEKF
jgi:sulfoxide reductase catalytic subunit YedY